METLIALNRDQGVTIVVVTHESDIAAYADRVVTMRDGASCPTNEPQDAPNAGADARSRRRKRRRRRRSKRAGCRGAVVGFRR